LIYFILVIANVNGFSQYLPVNREAEKWEIYSKDAGYAQVPPGSPYPMIPEDHPRAYAEKVKTGRILREYQLVYITSGTGWFEDEANGRRDIAAGDIFILFPGIKHAYSPYRETGWQEYWVGFAGKHAERLRANGLFAPRTRFTISGSIRISWPTMSRSFSSAASRHRAFRCCSVPWCSSCSPTCTSARSVRTPAIRTASWYRPPDRSCSCTWEDGIEVESLANEIGVQYPYLLQIFQQYTGLTPYQYYLQLRIHRSQELLQHDEMSIKEVAAQMSFDNQYYFSRLFKKKTGMTPSEWKKGLES
jgi:AraC-like DNA-binding protein